MKGSSQQLQSLVPPPDGGPFVEGRQVTACLARMEVIDQFPSDFVALVQDYGSGTFDDFISVLQPAEVNPHLDIARQFGGKLNSLSRLSRSITLPAEGILDGYQAPGEDVPYGTDLRAPGIIPWAVTDNGDVCYWITSQLETPDVWTVVVNGARGLDWQEFEMSATDFLVATLSGGVRVRSFPDDFPSSVPTFSPT